MASDHRMIDRSGNRIPFSCENRKYLTNINKGLSHQPNASTLGSVLEESLIKNDAFTLWLEHVIEKETKDDRFYWLMWYDEDGRPTMPMSSIFGKDDLEKMVGLLTRFVP